MFGTAFFDRAPLTGHYNATVQTQRMTVSGHHVLPNVRNYRQSSIEPQGEHRGTLGDRSTINTIYTPIPNKGLLQSAVVIHKPIDAIVQHGHNRKSHHLRHFACPDFAKGLCNKKM